MATAPAAAERPATAPNPPATMQWLYGSGEAGAASIQAYHAMRDYVLAAARNRPRDSVVLAPAATLAAPSFIACGNRPLAVVLDVDETVLLNLGYEFDDASHPGRARDDKRFGRWEQSGADKVVPVPGAVTALRAIREAGVTVIFNTNRAAENAAGSEAALAGAGLGPAKHGDTLYLRGDLGSGSGKDSRRADISRRFCVVAMAGDQFGDFTDLLNERTLGVQERRRSAASGSLAGLWGNGWFVLPNPVYGPGVRGTFDEVFPADKRWTDAAKDAR
ncbi:MAG: HAD family acid phosphatase [Croceibacterium sp.]